MSCKIFKLLLFLALGAGLSACPDGCKCVINIVTCPDVDDAGLKKVITSLPENVTGLVIGGPEGKANIKELRRDTFKGIKAPNLASLTLDSTKLVSVTNSALRPLTKLGTLILTGNPLQTIPNDLLAYSPNVQHLVVTYSPNFRKLEQLDASNLKHLDLSHNAIEFMEDTFSKLKQLNNLNIGYNGLTRLNPGLFIDLPLDTLDISQELPIKDIPDKPFETLHSLSTLGAAGIFSGAVVKNFFSGLLNLKTLDLSRNGLEEVPFSEMIFDDSLVELIFDENKLASLKSIHFQNKNLQVLSLAGNEIVSVKPRAFDSNPNLKSLTLRGNKLADLPDDIFAKLNQLQILDLSHNGLELSNRTLNALTNVNALNLSGNDIPELTRARFNSLASVSTFDLSKCSAKTVDADAFDSMPKLKTLDLNSNSLETVPVELLKRFKERDIKVQMANNLWACDCDSISATKAWMESNNFTDSMICSTPDAMRGKNVRDLSQDAFCYAPNVTECCHVTLKPYYGADVSLECNATGSPEPNITYSRFTDEPLPEGRYTHSDDWRHVTLLNLTYTDIGNYTCVAENSFGNVTKYFEVYVLTPEPTLEPSKPYKKGTLTWILLGVAIGIVLLVSIIGITVYFVKKRDSNPNDLLVENMENSIQ